MNYSDAGLFGFVAAAPASDAGKVVAAAANVLRSGKINESQLKRAKAQLKADLLMSQENSGALLEDLSSQALHNKIIGHSSSDMLSSIDKASLSDVNTAAAQLASAKLAVAALGNLSTVPYSDEL